MMGNQWCLVLHFVSVTTFLVATTNTCWGARNGNNTVACFEHELLALLEFKHSVKDASNMLSSWVGNDCCRWERVVCDYVTGNVGGLHLRGVDGFYDDECLISNKVSASLGEWRHLKYLDLSMNDFQESRIPGFIGSLKELTYLNLSYAKFSSIIPHHIGNLSNLKTLDLRSYGLYQELIAHDMTWISGLLSLEHLDLSNANLRGAKNLDMLLYKIPLLKELSLSRCGLSNVDLGSFSNLSGSLSNIRHLDLSGNSFKGQPPNFFQNMTSLQILDLSSSFDSSPTWNFANFLSMISSLLELRLSNCNLKETHLSHTLHNFTSLSIIQLLDLSNNKLTGPIPIFPRKLTKLYLSGNYLSGSIPESLGKLRLLQVLNLSHNKLTGPIPTFPEKLTELYLYENFLNGSIPESIGRLVALTDLDLSSNQFSGMIPVSIGQLSKLHFLDVSNNSLEGVVFDSHLVNLSMLSDLSAAYNTKLTFNVSQEWLPPF